MQDIFTSLHFLMRGGFMMYPLLVSGFISLVVIVDRFLLYRKIALSPAQKQTWLAEILAGKFTDVRKQSLEKFSPLAAVIAVGLQDPKQSKDLTDLAMKNQADAWVPILERRLEILDTIITAAPLMGLLGTITGMMASFQILSEKGINEPSAITGGVAEALIATATGLMIALLSLLFFNYFNQKVKNLIAEMELASNQVMEATQRFAATARNQKE